MKACIFDIKRFAVHDGPGIRVTVFLKGCSMSCWWCHNPEGIHPEVEEYTKETTLDGRIFCENAKAGEWISLNDLMIEIEKERIFMDESGGGVTFSGGEPFFQPEFLLAALGECQARSIHTCIDTSGYTTEKWIRQAARVTDLFLYDLKLIDEKEHLKFTGVSNTQILRNLKTLIELKANLNIRIPLIPGINDHSVQLHKMIGYLLKLDGITNVDILPYHHYARNKYRKFKRHNRLDGIPKSNDMRLAEIKKQFENAGFNVRIGG